MAINQYLNNLGTADTTSTRLGALHTGFNRRLTTDGYYVGAQPDPFLGGLSPVQFSSVMMKRFYATTILPRTTTAGDFKSLVGGHLGTSIVVPRTPEIRIRKLKVGQPRPLETSKAKPLVLEIKYGTEWGHFEPDVDRYFTNVRDFTQQISKGAVAKNAAAIERHCFGLFPDFVPSYNCGNNAGKVGGGYTLGTVASPAVITKSNVEDYLAQFLSVIEETDVGMESGQFTVVIPPKMAYMLRTSDQNKDASKRGERSSLKTRQIPTILDYDVYSSTLLAHATGYSDVWPIYAYTKEALAFAMAVNKVNTKEPDRVDGIEVYGQSIYGFDCEREDGVALGYVKFSDTAIDTGTGTSGDDPATQYDFIPEGQTGADTTQPHMIAGTPTANPKTEGFYEWDGTNGVYVASNDTSVNDSKTYYEEAL